MSDSEQPSASPRTVAVNLQWHVEDIEVPLELTLPADPVEPQAVLPALQKLVKEVVDISVKLLESRSDKTVTCKAGCGACCRQVVPISDIEAHAIAAVIERMPEERRAHVMARFADVERQLAELKPLDEIIEAFNKPGRWEFARKYFKYGVACPFLEDESCSIYPDRPLVCREYLVHTPVENCSDVTKGGVSVVPINRVSKALFRMSTIHDQPHETRVPLSLVPYWVARNPKNYGLTNGSEWIMRFVFSMEQADIDEEESRQQTKQAAAEQDAAPAGSTAAPSS